MNLHNHRLDTDNKASFWTQTDSIIPKTPQRALNNLPFKDVSNDNQD